MFSQLWSFSLQGRGAGVPLRDGVGTSSVVIVGMGFNVGSTPRSKKKQKCLVLFSLYIDRGYCPPLRNIFHHLRINLTIYLRAAWIFTFYRLPCKRHNKISQTKCVRIWLKSNSWFWCTFSADAALDDIHLRRVSRGTLNYTCIPKISMKLVEARLAIVAVVRTMVTYAFTILTVVVSTHYKNGKNQLYLMLLFMVTVLPT